MKALLDTHALLFLLSGDARLGAQPRAFIDDRGNAIFLSAGSLWEMAIKISLGKLRIDGSFESVVVDALGVHDVGLLSIEPRHALEVVTLPSCLRPAIHGHSRQGSWTAFGGVLCEST